MASELRRVDIGFQGGQVLAVKVPETEFEKLRKALGDDRGGRWHELKTQDSDVSIDLAQVVYVRLDTEENRVGF